MHIQQNLHKSYNRGEKKMEILKDKNNGNYIKDTNPFEKYQKIDNDVVSFYMQYNHLKNIYRQGWLKVRIGLEHREKCESVADHSFSMALLAITMIEKYKLPYDTLKCIKMCIIHELGEIYVGDYTPYDNITKEEKYLKEKEAIQKVLKPLDFDNDFLELWEEFEKKETEEAKFVKNLDELEFLLQSAAYELNASSFKRCIGNITDEHCKEIVNSLINLTKNNKKPKVEG